MVIYCCSDLLFATKIRSTADALGVPARPARDATMLQARLDQVDDGKGNDPVTLVLIDLDLGHDGVALIEQATAHHAAAPVVAFGSHVATELLGAARAAGADRVLPRSAFVEALPQMIKSAG